jgi:outer membrane protein
MRRLKELILLTFILFTATDTIAQTRLTLHDAVERTLKNNFDIRIASITKEQAEINNTAGNAGFLPNINAGISATESRTNVRSDLANGTQQNNPKAINTNVNPAVTANWTLYDGGRMFVVKKQLSAFEALTAIQLKLQAQSSVSRTIQMYAQLVLLQRQMIAIDTALHLARTRMDLSQLKYQSGAGAKIDYLQARVDYNARRADSLSFISGYAQACDSMSVLMGEQEGAWYRVDDALPVNLNLKETSTSTLPDRNLSLAVYKQNKNIADLNADIAKTYALPTLSISGAYLYNRSTNAIGFALFNRNYGGNGTINLSMPLFQGGNIRRQAKVASLQAMREELLYERQNTIIKRQHRTARRNYEIAVQSWKLATEDMKFARENLDVQFARFKVGVGTTLESREAENAYVQTLIRLYSSEYNVKLYETQVLELENKLLSD